MYLGWEKRNKRRSETTTWNGLAKKRDTTTQQKKEEGKFPSESEKGGMGKKRKQKSAMQQDKLPKQPFNDQATD